MIAMPLLSMVKSESAGVASALLIPNHPLLCESETMAKSTVPNPTVDSKRCCECGQVKLAAEFHRSRNHAGGLVAKCKECLKEYKATKWANREACIERGKQARREWESKFRAEDPDGFASWQYEKHKRNYEKHGVSIRRKRRQQRAENPEIKAKWNAATAKWSNENKDRVADNLRRYREKNKNDPAVRLDNKIMCGFWRCLRGQKSPASWELLTGYTADQLKARLIDTMPDGYSWEDYLNGTLSIDHIIPRSAFNYQTPDDVDFKKCYALGNLRLLSMSENRKKHATLQEPFQPSFSGL